MKHKRKTRGFVVISGYPASGKSVAKEVCLELGVQCLEFSDVLAEFAIKNGIDRLTDLRTLGVELRKAQGRDAVAKLMKQALGQKGLHEGVLIGARSQEEIQYLRKFFRIRSIAIITDKAIRHSRWIARGKSNDPATPEKADKEDEKEEQMGMAETVDKADDVIRNDGDIADFRQRLKNLIADYFSCEKRGGGK